MSIDDAFATPLILLRPSSFGIGAPRPRAALCIRFPGDARMREAVLRGLLKQRWQLVAAPAGEFEPLPEPHARVELSEGHVRAEAGGQTVFDGPLRLAPDLAGHSWHELSHAAGEIPVLVTAGYGPINTAADADEAARAGHLIGIAGHLPTAHLQAKKRTLT